MPEHHLKNLQKKLKVVHSKHARKVNFFFIFYNWDITSKNETFKVVFKVLLPNQAFIFGDLR